MGLLGPYVYETREKKKFWLHMKRRGKAILYYFSKEPTGALFNIPKGYEVVKTPRMSIPMLKKKAGGGMFGGVLKKGKTADKTEVSTAGTPQ